MGEKYTLDVCGEVCPVPVVKTTAMLDKMKAGDVLEVVVDYAPSQENVRRLAERKGFKVKIEEGAKIKLIIEK
jgi:tRNA 2-thiouridine synthesizing protein A